MNTLEKNISALATAITLVSPAAYADNFELAKGLTMSGFLDASYVVSDPETGGTDTDSGLDQFEINLMYDFGQGLTTVVDLEYQDNGGAEGEEAHFEQAYLNYAIDSNWSIKAGRFLSYSGWETEDPTGLFQYSGTGYAKYFYGAYQQGMSVKYSDPMFDVAVSLVNDLGTLTGNTRKGNKPAVELMLAVRPLEGLTAKGFYMTDTHEVNDEDIEQINVWTAYSAAGWTFAAEYNSSENSYAAVDIAGDEAEAEGYLLMANYATGKWGFTLRYNESEVETKAGDTVEDLSGITFAPSYKVHENLLLVAEYRMNENDITKEDDNVFAIEALVTF